MTSNTTRWSLSGTRFCIPFACLEAKWVQLVNFWQVCGIGGVYCFSQCASEEDALQFLGIQMANCARPPALNDEWQEKKKHIPSTAQLTSRLLADGLTKSVLNSTVGRTDVACTVGVYMCVCCP